MNGPDTRGMIVVGLFALVFFIFGLIAFVPALDKNELFKTLATLIVGTGFVGGAVAYYFNSSKSSSDKDAAISKQLDKAP
jgi:hypothetical protein